MVTIDMHMWIWYFAIGGCLASACDYGEPICPHSQKTIQWLCPSGQRRVLRAFWGRESGDTTTCSNGKAKNNKRTRACPGDDQKAIAAVTSWCDANINEAGECVITAPTQKLRWDGEKYDPCPGTLKYLKVCSLCECPKPTGVKQVTRFDVPLRASGITTTSTGNLAVTEIGGLRAAIFSKSMTLIKELNLPGPGWLYDITRYADTLFIVNYPGRVIYVVNENGTFIKQMDIGLVWPSRLVVRGNNMWVLTDYDGLHKLTFDTEYNVIESIQLVPGSEQFAQPRGIAVLPSYIVVGCDTSSNIHYLYHNGTRMFPPVHYDGPGAWDLEADSCGNVFLLNLGQSRLSYYYKGDANSSIIMTMSDGMLAIPFGMTMHEKVLYVSSLIPNPKTIIRIEFDWSF